MASNFIPNYGNESDISTNIQNGNLYVSEDTKRLFFDLNGNRIKISDIVFSDEKPLIGISGKLYVIKSDNSLWIFEDAWKQLNSGSSGSVNVDNKTINKNSDDEIQSIGVIDSRSGEPVKYWTGTLVQYNAIENKDENTIYNITDDIIDVNQSHFIPAGTVIAVDTDGSGQFTKLSEAIDYLEGKWSNGTVTIQLGQGQFEGVTFNRDLFNCSSLVIKGTTIEDTIVGKLIISGDGNNQTTIDTLTISVDPFLALRVTGNADVIIQNCSLKGTTGTSGTLITCEISGKVRVYNCSFSFTTKGGTAIYVANGLPRGLVKGCTFINVNTAMIATNGGTIYSYQDPGHTYTNVTTKINPSKVNTGNCYGYS